MVGILGAKIIGLEFWRLEQVMFLINQTFLPEVSCLLLQESEDLVFQNTALGRLILDLVHLCQKLVFSTYCTSWLLFCFQLPIPHKSINFKVLMVLCVYPMVCGENNG